MNKLGNVVLVGAGPGDRGLLTLRGKEVIEQAEVVIYDRLVSPEVMSLVSAEAEKINVGKRMDHHPVPQHQINQIILEKALEGKRVVRLKGGDSFLFGRGAEELELLRAHEIEYEVVPGITSAIAVPTYAGIPVTHRNLTSSVHIITGHAKAGAEMDIDFDALVVHKGTLIFLMGLTALETLMNGLLRAGMSADMPAATIEKGTTSFQRKVLGTVGTIAERVRAQRIESPAITIVGEVASLSPELDWFTQRPLIGKTILVTRPKERVGHLADKLRAQGAKVVEFPCIQTRPVDDLSPLTSVLSRSEMYDYVVFTSPNGVEHFFAALKLLKIDIRALHNLRIAAVGQQTRALLEQRGLIVDYMPPVYDSRHLSEGLTAVMDPHKKALLIRGNLASSILPDVLTKAGIDYDEVTVYETLYQNPLEDFMEEDLKQIDYAVFSSASTVEGFAQAMPTDFSKITAICIGEMTAEKASALGMRVYVSERATVESLIEKTVEVAQTQG